MGGSAIRGEWSETIETLDAAALAALEPEWRALWLQAAASPFQGPDWLLAWTRTFKPQEVRAVAVRRAGRLIGLAPFYLYSRPQDGRRQLTLLGNGLTDRLDLIAATGEQPAAARALAQWLDGDSGWDECDFRDLPAGSALLTLPVRAASDETLEEEPCPRLALPLLPDDVTALLSAKRRADIDRCARRAAETGALACETADARSLPGMLAEFWEVHERRWALRGEAAGLTSPATVAFHEEVAPALLAAGLLRLNLLRLDGKAIAGQYALVWQESAYSYLTAFDPAFARFAPGALVTALTLQQAVGEGAKHFDFLRGREPYKYAWGAQDAPQFRRRIRR